MKMLLFQERTFDAVEIVWRTLNQIADDVVARVPFMVIALIVIAIILGIGRLVRSGIMAAGRRTRMDLTLARLLARLSSAVVLILALLIAAVIIFPTFTPVDLVAGLGITSVAIGFAFKDVLQNFFAGILILWRRPFVIGDVISVNNYEGTVEEINIRATRIKTFDSERAIIPNGDVYTSAVLVQTAYSARRLTVTVGIGYPDDIETAREVINDTVRRTDGVLPAPEAYAAVTELAESTVNMTAYFWFDPRDSAIKLRDRVATRIKYALDEAGIDMPYPHSVVLFHDATGTREGDIDRREYLAAPNGGTRSARQ